MQRYSCNLLCLFFFFNDTATTEIYTLSLHDALPIFGDLLEEVDVRVEEERQARGEVVDVEPARDLLLDVGERSEEHTSELQSRQYLVCRLLLEKKKKKI